MGQAQALARRQQRVEELCAAAIRALTGEADLHFRGRRLHRGQRALPLFAPHLASAQPDEDFVSLRGAADAIALRLLYCDAELHRSLMPADVVQRLIFELLEQLRVEALLPAVYPGARRNLAQRFAHWADAFVRSRLTETARGIVLFTLAQVCRSRLSGEPVPEAADDLIESTRGRLSRLIGPELAALRRQRADQRGYARHALVIAQRVAELVASRDDERGDDADARAGDGDDDERSALTLLLPDIDAEAGAGIATADSGDSRVLEAAGGSYRVYTRAYDRELAAAPLVRAALLAEYRERLDRRIAAQGVNVGRLARQFKALLAAPLSDGWEGAVDDGRIDGRRLAQLVASPTERRLFRRERIEPVADCLVSFLIDCSGSMKAHIESIAMVVDVCVRALELAGVSSELLGFTTGAWNGGRAQRDWQRDGRPRHPGRLNEVCQLVFKDADTPWRRARRSIAALLKADLFREGVDGEAVDWAVARMQGRAEARRWLLVVSDGSPMDTATHLANDEHYLDHHLRQVVQRHEASGALQIAALGVGLDLSPYYSRSQALDLSAPPGNRVFQEILELIGGHRRG